MKLEIHLTDRDAHLFIPTEIWDEAGNMTGHLSKEEYQEEADRRKGKIIIRLRAYCGDRTACFESAIIDPADREGAIQDLFKSLAVSIQRNFYA